MSGRVAAALLAVSVLLSVMLCGCSGKRLTVREYGDEIKRCWGEFLVATTDWTKYAPETFPYTDEEIAGLKETISRREKALDDLRKINPPEKYADRHKELVKSLDYEYEWNKAALKLCSAESSEEADRIGEEIADTVNSIPDGESFPSVYMFLWKDLKAELDG